MSNILCDMCGKEKAVNFGETVRKSGGGGTIMNLGEKCNKKLPAINRKNRK